MDVETEVPVWLTLTGVVPVAKWLKAENGTTVSLRHAHRRAGGSVAAAGIGEGIRGQIARDILGNGGGARGCARRCRFEHRRAGHRLRRLGPARRRRRMC